MTSRLKFGGIQESAGIGERQPPFTVPLQLSLAPCPWFRHFNTSPHNLSLNICARKASKDAQLILKGYVSNTDSYMPDFHKFLWPHIQFECRSFKWSIMNLKAVHTS